jgi:hypothetical protein
MSLVIYTSPVLVAGIFIALTSMIREPARRKFMAVMLAGAGAAYLSAFGMGFWEFAFTAAVTWCAFRGLGSYRFIGAGWLLHTGWDIVHHLSGSPLLPFSATSSLGCAICDPVIALWCFAGAPSILSKRIELTGTTSPRS